MNSIIVNVSASKGVEMGRSLDIIVKRRLMYVRVSTLRGFLLWFDIIGFESKAFS